MNSQIVRVSNGVSERNSLESVECRLLAAATQLYSPFEKAAQLYAKKKKVNT